MIFINQTHGFKTSIGTILGVLAAIKSLQRKCVSIRDVSPEIEEEDLPVVLNSCRVKSEMLQTSKSQRFAHSFMKPDTPRTLSVRVAGVRGIPYRSWMQFGKIVPLAHDAGTSRVVKLLGGSCLGRGGAGPLNMGPPVGLIGNLRN